jgi:EAL domain-containing protein (putative c-di-GMP-specific phosphodiesterase class I)
VLRTACAQAKHWQQEGLLHFPVAVNVSAVQFHREPFLAIVRAILDETGLAPQFLELELTESLLLMGESELSKMLRGLWDMGVRLAIDDFGAGYCSFGYLKDFRFSKLKIDGAFVKAIATATIHAAITSAIVSMGKILGMKVIAECVETEAQLNVLRTYGCDQIQGYLFSRPLGASAFAELLRSRSSREVSESASNSLLELSAGMAGRSRASGAHR